jgi:uncharacterized membrane protein YjfL (UPF0719 family)
MSERIQQWLSTEPLIDLFLSSSALYFVLALILVFLARRLKSLASKVDLDAELTTRDNKALALETAGYFLAVMIVIGSTFRSSPAPEDMPIWTDLASSALWSVIAMLLLLLSSKINDRLLLRRFDNRKEILDDHNVGTGAVVAGTYIGTALIISASLQGTTGGGFWIELLDTLVFFTVGQLAFILLGALYQMASGYDIHKEIENDSAAAGIAFGMNLLAMGLILSAEIANSDSLVALVAWAVAGVLLLLFGRVLVDRFLLPGSPLDHEIAKDRNWGAALIEGGVALGLAFIINASFF